MTTSIQQKCFSIVESHPNGCFLYTYGDKIELFIEDSEIFSQLLNARFGSSFCLAYHDKRNIRRAINVLVDERRWIQISECMSSFLYNLTKRKS